MKLVGLPKLTALNSLNLGEVRKASGCLRRGAAAPKGRKLGHAGAIVNSSAETADAKKEALRLAGVEVQIQSPKLVMQ